MRYALSRSRVCAGTVECVMCCLGPGCVLGLLNVLCVV